MADTSSGLHEAAESLDEETIDRHRAIASLIEEMEAVDWYDQRVRATRNPELAAVLAHNRDEEKEHAMMTLEWLRRRDPTLDAHMRTYLFTKGDITELEEVAEQGEASEGAEAAPGGHDGSLGIGSLKSQGEDT